MSYCAALSPGGESFTIHDDETVLDAALRAGVALDYGCRHGNCSSCKYLLSDGEVDHGESSIYSLSEDERDDGWALLCCARPLGDLVIEARAQNDPRARPLLTPQTLGAELVTCERLTSALWQLELALDAPLAFYPGQFVELTPPWADVRRSYSIASAPSQPGRLRFVIKEVPGGAFSAGLAGAAPGARFEVRGPFGNSYLREGSAPVLLCAIGSGIAPLLSILEDAADRDDPRPFHLYYGARTPADLPEFAALERARAVLGERLQWRPCLSRPPADWDGRHGRVTQAMQREVEGASELDAYLCGAPEMCDALGILLEAKGIREGQLFFDKFHAAS